jgi:REP-associated tyrosine transposase
MARPLRVQDPGYYHLTTRGNDGTDIYLDVVDRRLFISMLNRIAGDSDWALHAWCLMTNHFHLVVENRQANLSAGMHRLNSVYARWFNERHARTGHLFGSRFGAKPIVSDRQLYNTAEYVFDNPVRAGLCKSRVEWPWLGGTFWRDAVAA